eukprot:TRINITY_DN12806_c0_g1_i1.p1 TRINITY_DN12806_c0_g1~~TRINITY_DN12806_c0_g1_i1.p1  ORF type:complete len:173 (-),score=28.30 TRINITY_DN12806_c0_g1_i1:496-1014(-)
MSAMRILAGADATAGFRGVCARLSVLEESMLGYLRCSKNPAEPSQGLWKFHRRPFLNSALTAAAKGGRSTSSSSQDAARRVSAAAAVPTRQHASEEMRQLALHRRPVQGMPGYFMSQITGLNLSTVDAAKRVRCEPMETSALRWQDRSALLRSLALADASHSADIPAPNSSP